MKQLVLYGLILSLSIPSGFSQTKKAPTDGSATPTATPGLPPALPKINNKPKPYKDIITDKAVTKKGLFTIHKIEEKYYLEIADSILGLEIMAVSRLAKVPSGAGYGGEIANQQTLLFEKGPSDNLFIRTVTLINTADSTEAIYKAVTNSNVNSIAAVFPIAAYTKDSLGYVIEVTDFFKGDNQIVSMSPSIKRKYNFMALALDRSYIKSINSYPQNVEVRTVKTFSASSGPMLPGSIFSASNLPAAADAGAVTMELNTSFIVLPKVPMQKRFWDKRVGYFQDDLTIFSDQQQRAENKSFAIRWRLEPKDEDVEKWKKGGLVEPKKPIIYYIDPATPKKWRQYLIAGINDWQIAFEKAGFKNAIQGKEWPENDTTMSLEDARFSVLRYFASNIENAYGPNVHDPRSGEILESHIGWYHNVMKLLHDWYMIQTAAVDPKARKMKFDDALMGDLIRFVSSHEVGHTLGLMHNMGSSSKTPVEKLRNKAWVEANGHTASIMDYARFNYVAQPEDNISAKGLYPRIGDYDIWAIRWGYGYIQGNTEEAQKKASNELIKQTIAQNPRTWFGTYEFGNVTDPRTQSEDLSDDAIAASNYGIKNLKRIIVGLPQWTKEEANLYESLDEMYTQLLNQFRRYVGHVMRNIGGVYETPKSAEEETAVFEITPKQHQKNALLFLQQQVFETPYWLLNKDILNKCENPSFQDPVFGLQESALNSLLNTDRLLRLQWCADRFGATNAYTTIEMLNDVQNGLFSEISNNKAADTYRRTLQKSYVDKLINFVNHTAELKRTDLPAIARAKLQQLHKQMLLAANTNTDNMTRIHLADLAEKIKNALYPH